ncbi:MAG: hypothetical protein IIX39_00765 [Clostridia bacterium]|nr:hypothetical protein [Clostridia bacterium]
MENSKNELWNKFYESGKVEDYLRYCKSVTEAENKDVIEHPGHSHQGTDAQGKRQDNLSFN